MNTAHLSTALAVLCAELVDGPPDGAALMLNRSDPGLLRSLDRVTAADASTAPPGVATVAAHVDHLRYGLSLLNRWAAGEHPFANADYGASWRRTRVSDDEWRTLCAELAEQVTRWQTVLASPGALDGLELDVVLASVAHLAYHLGAIRQLVPSARGPREIG